MKSHFLISLILAISCYVIFGLIVDPKWKIYYDLRTNRTIDLIDSSNPRLQLYRYQMRRLRLGFGPIPCNCQDLTCGCCAGMNIQTFDFNRKACLNFTYVPQDFAINMDMYMDDDKIFNNSISGKNPPPLCMPMPIPYLPSVDFCVRFFNVHTIGYNLYSCMDFETRIERAPILILHFDCLQMGQEGISYHKPDEAELEIEGPSIQQEDEEIEVYDEVIEDENTTSSQPNKSFLKPDESFKENERRTQTEIYDEVFEEEEEPKKNQSMIKEKTSINPSRASDDRPVD